MTSEKLKKQLLQAQRDEITEHIIYNKLAEVTKNAHNKQVLTCIANEELAHYKIWKKYTQQDVEPSRYKVWKYYLLSRLFGLTFGMRLLEKVESQIKVDYDNISKEIPIAARISKEEEEHEKKLIGLISEDHFVYVGSIVLGLNDALVELTGALAGLTLALANSRLIAMVGLITGIAASLSMAASEYLATRSEEEDEENSNDEKNEGEDKDDKHSKKRKNVKDPKKAAVYTAIGYITTVFVLIFPYLILSNVYHSLVWTMCNGLAIVFLFTYYVAVSKDQKFWPKFLEMAIISLSVATASFFIGYGIRYLFGVE